MRVRVIGQTFTDLWRNRRMLNPFYSGFFAVQLISHKLLRYAVPLFLIIIFIATAILTVSSLVYALILMLQIVFYLMALGGWILERSGKSSGVFAIPLYFTLANLASLIGFYKFLSGERYAHWEPIRESKNTGKIYGKTGNFSNES